MSKKPYRYRPIPLRHGKERVRCFRTTMYPENEVCVIGHKYGFEGRLYAKGHSYQSSPSGAPFYISLSVGRARTLKAAASGARQFLRRLRQR